MAVITWRCKRRRCRSLKLSARIAGISAWAKTTSYGTIELTVPGEDRAVAGSPLANGRKVRAPQGRVLRNAKMRFGAMESATENTRPASGG